jgi:hypothetical protein
MFHVKHPEGDQMDFEEKLKNLTVNDFMVALEDSPRHDFGPHSVNRRVCGFLNHVYGLDGSMWDVVVDGPGEWQFAAGVGPKIIEALARAINIEMGAPIVPTALPTKERREEGYFWTQERLTEAAQMLGKGDSYRTVAAHFNKNVDGMKAALKRYGMYQPRFSGSWHPIETAPKDGTVIIVYGRFPYKENVQTVFYQTAAWTGGGWTNAADSWLGDVTHWMPLPPPPK